jgi:hypothetical protein
VKHLLFLAACLELALTAFTQESSAPGPVTACRLRRRFT